VFVPFEYDVCGSAHASLNCFLVNTLLGSCLLSSVHFLNFLQIVRNLEMTTPAGPLRLEEYERAQAHPRDPPEIVAGIEEEHPTESHALAAADHEEKGAAQLDHGEPEVRDLGWNEDEKRVPQLVGGLPNEELWTLIRRFDKVYFHAKNESQKLMEIPANVPCQSTTRTTHWRVGPQYCR
jgi:hypothetical protein